LLGACGSVSHAQLVCPTRDQLVPIYEQHEAHRAAPLLTADPRDGYLLGSGLTRVAFYALPAGPGGTCPAGTANMRRLFDPTDGSWFYTSAPLEFTMKQWQGWQPDPTPLNFCVADKDEPKCDLVPLMRLNNTAGPSRPIAYTTSMREERQCVTGTTCTYDPTTTVTWLRGNDAMARVWPKPVPYLTRTYRAPYASLSPGSGAVAVGATQPNQRVSLKLPDDFAFAFFGRPRSTVFATTNGLISFEGDVTATLSANRNAPDQPWHRPPYNSVAGWWQPSLMTLPGAMLMQVVGTAPNRHFVVQWGQQNLMGP
jgi:hypothetical protein